ncbi:hypothetical protein IGI04_018664, partial [Brassica rapa subsp. trilocularis]
HTKQNHEQSTIETIKTASPGAENRCRVEKKQREGNRQSCNGEAIDDPTEQQRLLSPRAYAWRTDTRRYTEAELASEEENTLELSRERYEESKIIENNTFVISFQLDSDKL